MRGRKNPVQSVRWRHVDAAIKQAEDESRILRCIDELTIVAIVVDCVAARKVNLKHWTKPLHNRVNFSSTKHFTETGDRGIAEVGCLPVHRAVVSCEPIALCRDQAHSVYVAL